MRHSLDTSRETRQARRWSEDRSERMVRPFGDWSPDQLREAAEAEGRSPEEIVRLELRLNRAAGQDCWLSEERSRALSLRMAEFARQRYIHPPVQIWGRDRATAETPSGSSAFRTELTGRPASKGLVRVARIPTKAVQTSPEKHCRCWCEGDLPRAIAHRYKQQPYESGSAQSVLKDLPDKPDRG